MKIPWKSYVGFIKTHVDRCRLNNQNHQISMWKHLICILNSGCHEPALWKECGSPNAQSHRMCILASTPTKLGTKLLESMFVARPFSFAACLIGIGQSPHLLSLYYRLQRKQIQNLSNVFKFYLLSGRLSGIHGKTLCEEHGERKWTSHHYSVRRQQTCFAKVVRNAPGSKDGLLGKFPERTQTVIFFAAI